MKNNNNSNSKNTTNINKINKYYTYCKTDRYIYKEYQKLNREQDNKPKMQAKIISENPFNNEKDAELFVTILIVLSSSKWEDWFVDLGASRYLYVN